ncbi:phosphoglycerol geranylgeranyltransferase [Cecembia rubra]|uniref:Geranylgeranylglyceryl phosphate synthase n=1 Tax=Cecembia rubra TaxID=1485585 RepID=A0A2P8E098_9BACT|nr:phosphoglycerol geranylgeranyltransferase [Cecembia rubra]PSL02896.1 putative glycerol-1-phosphate prenyltransferase [Cecembia rubra]
MRNEVGEKLKSIVRSGRKGIAWLIDPDDMDENSASRLQEAKSLKIDFIFLGGSLIQKNNINDSIRLIRMYAPGVPIVLFPGSSIQFSEEADAILFLSLISGRNPELLIGQHVSVAPIIAKSNIEVLPTGYMLIDGGEKTSVHYISQTIPLPNHHPELSVATALAGYYLGLQYFYLDAGSGAPNPVNSKIIKSIKQKLPAPLIVGGGLNSLEKVKAAFLAGADLVVIGNGAGKSSALLKEVNSYLETYRIMAN